MKLKIRLINKKWLELEICTNRKCTYLTYWGGFQFSKNVIYGG